VKLFKCRLSVLAQPQMHLVKLAKFQVLLPRLLKQIIQLLQE